MRTLFLNPPSFEGFDGGASSRWPASREIESYWYPVWLCYPAGMLPDSKVVDAPPHKISIEQTVEMAKQFELLVLYTSTPGFHVDVKMAERFTANCKKLGLLVHGDYIIGLPGETRESIRRTIDFAKRLDTETIQVSIAHPYPGTEFYDYVKKNNLITIDSMTDETGHQLPNVVYPGLDRGELVEWVERFYGEYFVRLRVIWRIVKKAVFNGEERRRLTKEAREYLALRSKRKKFVAEQKAAAEPAPAPVTSGD